MTIDEHITERISDLNDIIFGLKSDIRELKSLGGHSCYGAGYDEGLMEAYNDELEFLTKVLSLEK